MPNTTQNRRKLLYPEKINLCYLALPLGAAVSNAYGLMILALPIVFIACYIFSLTRCGEYQLALNMTPHFTLSIAMVYGIAAIHPATAEIHSKIYIGIATIAFCYWLYCFVRDVLHYWRQRDRS